MPTKEFTRAELERDGFVGWITFSQMHTEDKVPRSGGVYVVARTTTDPPAFLATNPGGRFKDQDPTVPDAALRSNWVDGSEVVYIGKADELRRRLRQFSDFGTGKPVGHWGGRLIWQLGDAEQLLVAWKETPGQVPKQVETDLISEFRATYGKPPFANEPHRLGK
jgi:hypothetical protein